jgi:hypothetical protein
MIRRFSQAPLFILSIASLIASAIPAYAKDIKRALNK